jgi:hypothetical protein
VIGSASDFSGRELRFHGGGGGGGETEVVAEPCRVRAVRGGSRGAATAPAGGLLPTVAVASTGRG